MDAVLEADPAEEGDCDGEVEEAFVRDGEDDEERAEGKEGDCEAVEVVVLRLERVEERHHERGNQSPPSGDLGTKRQALLRLERAHAGTGDQHCQSDESNLHTHNGARDTVRLVRGKTSLSRSSLYEQALLK